MKPESTFKIFVPLLKASRDADGRMRFHGVASSSIKDRHGDTITRSALSEMEASANNNMTIFLNHSYEVPEDVAGSVERALLRSHPTDPEIQDLVFDIVVNGANERAVKAWEAIDNGTKLGLSIGARIPDGGAARNKESGRYIINHIDLLETSIVGVPANPRSWVEYAVKSLNGGLTMTWADDDAPPETGEVIERSDGEVGYIAEMPLEVQTAEAVPGGEPMVGIEVKEGETATLEVTDDQSTYAADGSLIEEKSEVIRVEVLDAADVELEKAKKPADHTHPHAHEHDHDHTHWNGIQHSHEHAHTHAHGHDDSHEHVDDMQGSEHDHSHQDSYGDNEHPHSQPTKGFYPDLTGDELVAHLAELDPPPITASEGSDGAASAPQEAPSEASGPENGEAPDDQVDTEKLYEPITVQTLRAANETLATVTRELIETRSALETAERERDQAVEMSTKALSDTATLLKRIAETPMGRRTVVTETVTAFDNLKSVYGEAFVDLLTKKDRP